MDILLDEEELNALEVIWNSMLRREDPIPSDLILCFGSSNLLVARQAAKLYLDGYAPHILVTGGYGKLSKDIFAKTEAQLFAEACMACGVPESALLLEDAATNTGDNVRFARRLLEKKDIAVDKVLLVSDPFASLRVYATQRCLWPEVTSRTCPEITRMRSYMEDKFVLYSSIATKEYTIEKLWNRVISHICGDVWRMLVYPEKQWQSPVPIREEAVSAMFTLVRRGYGAFVPEAVRMVTQ